MTMQSSAGGSQGSSSGSVPAAHAELRAETMSSPPSPTDPATVRVAAIGDIHAAAAARSAIAPMLRQLAESADVIAICGDLTDHGLPEEALLLRQEIQTALRDVPVVAVLGNHDYETGHAEEVRQILVDGGVTMLDGDAVVLRGIGFAGVKGFCGGFGRGTLSAFGEAGVKRFVQEAIDEALKLEQALQRLRAPHRIAVLHYSPIRATVEGEPEEIFPFLGCSRLEEPLNRYQVTACIHGHAHRGAPEGKTAGGIPVYNVAVPVMRTAHPDRPPFRVLHLPAPVVTEKTAGDAPHASSSDDAATSKSSPANHGAPAAPTPTESPVATHFK